MERDKRQTKEAWQGATGTPLEFKAVDLDGVPINLTGSTVTMNAVYDGVLKFDEAECDVTAGGGQFEIAPLAGQIDVVGEYDAQHKIIEVGGAVIYLEPFILNVRKPVGV